MGRDRLVMARRGNCRGQQSGADTARGGLREMHGLDDGPDDAWWKV